MCYTKFWNTGVHLIYIIFIFACKERGNEIQRTNVTRHNDETQEYIVMNIWAALPSGQVQLKFSI